MASLRTEDSQAISQPGIRILRPADPAQEADHDAATSYSVVADSSTDLPNLEQRLASLCDMPKQLSIVLDKVSKVLTLLQESERCASLNNRRSLMSTGRLSNLDRMSLMSHGSLPSPSASFARPSSIRNTDTEQTALYGTPTRTLQPPTATPLDRTMSTRSNSSRSSAKSHRAIMAGLCGVPRSKDFSHVNSGRSQNSAGSRSAGGSSNQANCASPNAKRISTVSRLSRKSNLGAIQEKRRSKIEKLASGKASDNNDTSSDNSATALWKEGQLKVKKCYSLAGLSEDAHDFTDQDVDHYTCMLHPGSGFCISWDLVVIGCTTFLGVLIPLGLVYCQSRCLRAPIIQTIFSLVDIIFISDVVLHFRTGFWVDSHMVLNPWRVARRYVRSWFLIELLSAWPLSSAWFIDSGFLLWLPHYLKLLRLLELPKLLSTLQKETRWQHLTFIRIGLVISLTLHVISCSWRLVQRLDGVEELDTWPATYVQDAYWVIMTVTTVGYGDVSPKDIHGRIYAIFLMVISSVCFGATVSALTHMSSHLFHNEVESRVASAIKSMRERRVPIDLQYRVQTNLRKNLRQDNQGSALDPELLCLLSPALQRDLLLSLLSSTVLQFPLFNGAQRSFLAEIAQAHTWMQCLQYDLIVSAGQVIQDVFFVIHGILSVRSPPTTTPRASNAPARPNQEEDTAQNKANTDPLFETEVEEEFNARRSVDLQPTFRGTKELQIETGAWFGEACLFMEGVVSSSTIVAACEAELAVLAECDYNRIIQKYPRLLARHRKISQAINEGNLELEELAYSRPDDDGQARPSLVAGGTSDGTSGGQRLVRLLRSMTPTRHSMNSVSQRLSAFQIFPISSGSTESLETGFSEVGVPSKTDS